MNAWEMYEEMIGIMGESELLEALVLSLGTFELKEHLDFIARMHDIEL